MKLPHWLTLEKLHASSCAETLRLKETLLVSGEDGPQFTLICGTSSGDDGMWMTGESYYYTGSRSKASLLCEFSHETAGWSCI